MADPVETNMGLTLPIPGTSTAYGAEVTADLSLIANHDHTSGKGVPVPASAISGLAAVATSGSASDLGTGTLPSARLPNTGPGAGAIAFPASITLDAQGRVAAASAGTAPLLPANNLSDVASAATARSNLGLAPAADNVIGNIGAGVTAIPCTATGRAIIAAASAAAARTVLGIQDLSAFEARLFAVNLAQQRIGTLALPPVVFFDDLDSLVFFTDGSAGSGASALTNDPGGTFSLSTGATANSTGRRYHLAGGVSTILPAGSTKKWHSASYAKITTTPNANTEWSVNGNMVRSGVSGANSTTKYSVRFQSGSTFFYLTSTVDIDGNFHLFEVWCDGTHWFLSVDGETPVTRASLTLDGNDFPNLALTNGATAANQAAKIDWISIVAQRN